jgi:hypothetical protein
MALYEKMTGVINRNYYGLKTKKIKFKSDNLIDIKPGKYLPDL